MATCQRECRRYCPGSSCLIEQHSTEQAAALLKQAGYHVYPDQRLLTILARSNSFLLLILMPPNFQIATIKLTNSKKQNARYPAAAAEDFRLQLNNLLDEAERNHVSKPALIKLLEGAMSAVEVQRCHRPPRLRTTLTSSHRHQRVRSRS
jgi:hypothetical protein